ncbi:MAG: helix-turn-helix domain-containing protein [Nitrospirota bacterium]
MWRTLDTIVMDEVATHQIIQALEQGPGVVRKLADQLKLPPPHVLRYVLALQRRGLVELDGIEGTSPRYRLAEVKAA